MTADKSENKLAMDLHMGWHMRKWTQSYVDECLTNLNNGAILYSSEAGPCCVIVISLNLYVRVTIKTISIARTVTGTFYEGSCDTTGSGCHAEIQDRLTITNPRAVLCG